MGEKPKLLIVTAVWGSWHIGAFLNLNLPTLMAPGNFPAIVDVCNIHYIIYTTRRDRAQLEKAPMVIALSGLMTVEFKILKEDILSDPIAAHHLAWRQATEQAADEGRLVLLMPPDVAWADNSFRNVGQRLAEGYQAIFMTYLRAEEKSFSAALKSEPRSSDNSLSVRSDRMVELCLNSLHPLMAAYLADAEYFPVHPEMIIWPVPGEGLLVRVLAREMFLFDPREIVLNKMRLADKSASQGKLCFFDDSDELFAVSLAPVGKDAEWHLSPHRADPIEVGEWWSIYDSAVNDFIVSHHIRWHFASITETRWRIVEHRSDLFVRRAAGTREGIRFWQAARRLGLSTAAGLIAVAAQTGTATRALVGRGKAVAVLLPTERAFENLKPDRLNSLLMQGNEQHLSELMRAHVLVLDDHEAMEEDPLLRWAKEGHSSVIVGRGEHEFSMSYADDIWINGYRVLVGPPISAGIHKVYVIDGILLET